MQQLSTIDSGANVVRYAAPPHESIHLSRLIYDEAYWVSSDERKEVPYAEGVILKVFQTLEDVLKDIIKRDIRSALVFDDEHDPVLLVDDWFQRLKKLTLHHIPADYDLVALTCSNCAHEDLSFLDRLKATFTNPLSLRNIRDYDDEVVPIRYPNDTRLFLISNTAARFLLPHVQAASSIGIVKEVQKKNAMSKMDNTYALRNPLLQNIDLSEKGVVSLITTTSRVLVLLLTIVAIVLLGIKFRRRVVNVIQAATNDHPIPK